ncbi:hypothetical protein SEA_STEAMY_44 [Mycobacterium phage Steamy]|uniref:Uncharacterized protein n=1 Tax=Mycobacterium phage Steamy TaxID=2250309 RepID=A0A345L0L7_9CAUD|nr:hypothetical protein KIV62_gp57 [Mycobacterium phage Steamy]AXH48819.1 hypothetical protein SEA_STEAMY_44 [Mycobacterium phage Steamy]
MRVVAVAVTLADGSGRMIKAEPLLDAPEGILVLLYENGTKRVFNWDFVVDYTELDEEEYADWRQERDADGTD